MTHECPKCGEQTEGSYSEGGVKWALCAECLADQLDQDLRDKAADKEGEYESPPPYDDETPDDFGDEIEDT